MCKKRNIYTMSELNLAMMSAFNALNNELFNNELEKVVITFEEGYKKGAYGWIHTVKDWKQGKEERYNINISSDYLDRKPYEIIATLVHEMCHLYALQNGIKDTSRSGIYHNRKFKEIAEAHALNVYEEDNIGYRTKASDKIITWTENNCTFSEIRIQKKKHEKAGAGTTSKQSSRKYICPSCGLIVRATKECNIICGDCQQQMKIES